MGCCDCVVLLGPIPVAVLISESLVRLYRLAGFKLNCSLGCLE
jgi:hypothetical protein